MSDEILVDLGWLAGFSSEIGETTADLRAAPNEAVNVSSSPELPGGVERFMKKWDEQSGQLADTLDAVQELADAIRESFGETDRALGNATESASGGD